MMNEHFYLSLLMFLAGVGIPVMAAINANLGRELQSPMMAVLVLCCVALMMASVFVVFGSKPTLAAFKEISPVFYLGGFLFILYIGSITYAAPTIGVGNAVFFVLLGQLVTAAFIDHYGLLKAPISAITYKRVLGIVLMIISVYLARQNTLPPDIIK